MNWNDPEQRLALIERVGAQEYTRLMWKHHDEITLATINGHRIRPVGSRFGRLFLVEGTDKAFRTLDEAKDFAAKVTS
jgi:hypothetical protein